MRNAHKYTTRPDSVLHAKQQYPNKSKNVHVQHNSWTCARAHFDARMSWQKKKKSSIESSGNVGRCLLPFYIHEAIGRRYASCLFGYEYFFLLSLRHIRSFRTVIPLHFYKFAWILFVYDYESQNETHETSKLQMLLPIWNNFYRPFSISEATQLAPSLWYTRLTIHTFHSVASYDRLLLGSVAQRTLNRLFR